MLTTSSSTLRDLTTGFLLIVIIGLAIMLALLASSLAAEEPSLSPKIQYISHGSVAHVGDQFHLCAEQIMSIGLRYYDFELYQGIDNSYPEDVKNPSQADAH